MNKNITRLSMAVLSVGMLLFLGTSLPQAAARGSTTYTVTNTNDSGAGSLYQAILDANANPGLDTITFAIPGAGPHTITIIGILPTITDSLFINGWSQGGLGYSGPPLIVITGTASSGLTITSGNNTVCGLVISGFVSNGANNGILLSGAAAANNWIYGNYIGTDASGTSDWGNAGAGIRLELRANHNLIGTNGDGVNDSAERNLISGNDTFGINITGADYGTGADYNIVAGNIIGTDITGSFGLPNSSDPSRGAVYINSADNNRIGTDGDGNGFDANEENLISGNIGAGVQVGGDSTYTVIAGNRIGTNAAGTADLGNTGDGVALLYGTAHNRVGTDTNGVADDAERNIISGNDKFGVQIHDNYVQYNMVAGNYIGTDISGVLPVGNTLAGVNFGGTSNNNLIGGTTAASNVIAFNGYGITMSGFGSDPYNNAIRRNRIFSNTNLGIDLSYWTYPGDGITPNDGSPDADLGPNRLQNFPVLSNASPVSVQGTLTSAPNKAYEIDLYANQTCHSSGYGQGEIYLTTITVNTDASGTASFNASFPYVTIGYSFTATATDPNGNTSEFSACQVIPGFTVTNADDSGAGSLRQAILDANARPGLDYIGFDIPGTGVHTIALTSILPVITDPIVIDGTTQPGANCASWPPTLKIEIKDNGTGMTSSDSLMALSGGNSVVRGLVINEFPARGLSLLSDNNVVECNFIGPDVTGTQRLVSLDVTPVGIHVEAGAKHNRIGTNGDGIADNAERNLISGNRYGVEIWGTGTDYNVIAGNYIGTDVTGTLPLPNVSHIGDPVGAQIYIALGAQHNLIGTNSDGTADEAERNVLSSDDLTSAVYVDGNNTNYNTIAGNYIGTDVTGSLPLGNGVGITFMNGASNNLVGGNGTNASNVIAYNQQQGIVVFSNSIGNSVVHNRIFSNGGLGIDLDGLGQTPNDPGDIDPGPNNLQNYPVLTSAAPTIVQGTLNSTPNTTFTLEFFSNTTCDTSGYGEGETFQPTSSSPAVVATDASGNVSFTFVFTGSIPDGRVLTATATDPAGNTSEFSACLPVETIDPADFIVTNTNDSGAGSLRQAILNANAAPGSNTITFNIPGTDPQIIRPLSPLPDIGGVISQGTWTGKYYFDANGNQAFDSSEYRFTYPNLDQIDFNWGMGNPNPPSGSSEPPLPSSDNFLIRWTSTVNVAHNTQYTIQTWSDNGVRVIVDPPGNPDETPGYAASWAWNINAWVDRSYPTTPDQATVTLTAGVHTLLVEYYEGSGSAQVRVSFAQPVVDSVIIDGLSQPGASCTPWPPTLKIMIDGTNAGSGSSGLHVKSDGSTIRGLVIGNFASNGLWIDGGDHNTVQCNFIGTDAAGTAAQGNSRLAGEGVTSAGVLISGGAANNLIGTNADGTQDAAERNLISGNVRSGVVITGTSITGNTVAGNLIGTTAAGSAPLGNGADGILLDQGAYNNRVGGTASAASNTIAYNAHNGIQASSTAGTRNQITGNNIYSHGQLGIDLNGDGVSPNDTGDGDTGPNQLQNYPVLIGAVTQRVYGTLNSTPNTTFTLEFFHSTTCDSSGYGEGATRVTTTASVTTDASGNVSFDAGLAPWVNAGEYLTATATDPNGNTSEFSACRAVGAGATLLVVTNTNPSGAGSLANAVDTVNSQGGGTIVFSIPGPVPHIIQINKTLQVKKSATIDGTTQPGYVDHPVIEIRPSSAFSGPFSDGIYVEDTITFTPSLQVTIRGLAINSFPGPGILLGNGQGNVVELNYIGTDASGQMYLPNDTGVISRSPYCVIRNNVIAADKDNGTGIYLSTNYGRNGNYCTITGNIIGMTADKQTILPNWMGIRITEEASHNTIGGTTPESRNIIAGSKDYGILIDASQYDDYPSADNIIQGNLITRNGTGICFSRTGDNIIGGTVGTTPGGPCTGACNLISGNNTGINIQSEWFVPGNTIQGNFIGTDITGTTAYPNATGISIGTSINIIGGTTPQAGNLISGNTNNGIRLAGSLAIVNVIQGNTIGTDTTGTIPLSNGAFAINIGVGVHSTLIGGTTPGAGNIIAYSQHPDGLGGIYLSDIANKGIIISGNSIFSNAGLGIELYPLGPTPNDAGDLDDGPNGLQNYPVLTRLVVGPPSVVSGTMNSKPNTTYTLEFFSGKKCDPSGYGEGQYYQPVTTPTTVTTNSSGNASFSFTLANRLPPGHVITATAIDPEGNTSEFSACKRQINNPPQNLLPLPQTSIYETPFTFSSGQGNLISISDPDALDDAVQVTLSVSVGTLTLHGVQGLAFITGDGAADPTMTFSGSLDEIGAALNGLVFTSPSNFVGTVTLTVISNDLGHNGEGGPKSDTDILTITVQALIATPSDLTAAATHQTQIDLGWTDNSFGETATFVERQAENSTEWVVVDSAAPNVTTYQDMNLECETTYTYRTRAYRAASNIYSAYSNTASAATGACAGEAAPDLLKPTDGTLTKNNRPIFEWSSVDYATAYQFQIDADEHFVTPDQDAVGESP